MNITENSGKAHIFHSRPQAKIACDKMNKDHRETVTSPWRIMNSKFGYAVSALTPNGIVFIEKH